MTFWDEIGKAQLRIVNWSNECHPDNRNEFKIMQYTGLKDKNGSGKEIYEGDIVEYEWRTGNGKERFVVEWDDKQHGFDCLVDFLGGVKSDLPGSIGGELKPLQYKIIGNIYENPELLDE